MINSTLDKLERSLILRIARALPLALAALAALALVASLVLFVYGISPVATPSLPAAEAAPPAVEVTAQDIRAKIAAGSPPPSTQRQVAAQNVAAPQPPGPSAGAILVAQALHRVRSSPATAALPWLNQTERYCADAIGSMCWNYQSRIVRRGAGPMILDVLEQYDSPASTLERVQVPGTTESYMVNGANPEQKSQLLGEVVTLLEGFEAEGRLEALAAWSSLRISRERERAAAISAAEERAAAARAAAYEAERQAGIDRSEARSTALLGALGGLAAIFVTGLILAVLAIERNTRMLHALSVSQGPLSAGR